MRKLFFTYLFLILCYSVCLSEDKSGELEGLLISVGEKGESVEIIPDGSEKAIKYIPEWVGGNPKDGGNLKKETVEAIKKLIIPNRVLLKWKNEEDLRVVEIKILEPERIEGSTLGTVTIIKETWFEIKTIKNGKVQMDRFTPRWIGKDSKDGSLDKDMLNEIKKLKIEDSISVNWIYEEKKRVKTIELMSR